MDAGILEDPNKKFVGVLKILRLEDILENLAKIEKNRSHWATNRGCLLGWREGTVDNRKKSQVQ